eukprot:960325_1
MALYLKKFMQRICTFAVCVPVVMHSVPVGVLGAAGGSGGGSGDGGGGAGGGELTEEKKEAAKALLEAEAELIRWLTEALHGAKEPKLKGSEVDAALHALQN